MTAPTFNGIGPIHFPQPSTVEPEVDEPRDEAPQQTESPETTSPQETDGPADEPATESATVDQSLATADSPRPNSPHSPHKPWPLLVIGLAAAVAVWSGWVGLGQMAGFGVIHPLPGIVDGFRINTAVVLPLSVEAYAAYALRVWLGTTTTDERAQRFAKYSAIVSMTIGAIAQVAYHLMVAAGYVKAPWLVVMLVATVPVIVLGLASALAKLVTSGQISGN